MTIIDVHLLAQNRRVNMILQTLIKNSGWARSRVSDARGGGSRNQEGRGGGGQDVGGGSTLVVVVDEGGAIADNACGTSHQENTCGPRNLRKTTGERGT